MNRHQPIVLAGILASLLSTAGAAELDSRQRQCYDAFLQCIDAIPEQGTDGRYPVARENACESAYRACKVQFDPSSDTGTPPPGVGGPRRPGS